MRLRVGTTLRPRDLGNVNESFDARLELDENAVLGDRRNLARDLRIDRINLDNRRPGIRQQLLVSERNLFLFAVELQNLDLDVFADLETVGRILQSSPRHVGHVQQSVDAADVDERTVLGEVLDRAFDDVADIDLVRASPLSVR